MKWRKQGLIYVASGEQPWAHSHAMIPTPHWLNEDALRIYLTTCDASGIGRIGYIDVDPNDPSRILKRSSKPVLDIGLPGTFDENGVLQTSIVDLPDGRKYLYYVGFELGSKIRYRLLTGLAVSDDGGETFVRVKNTPVLERSHKELYFRCGPFVLLDQDIFKLWYVAGSDWTDIDGKAMPVYTINYLESADGIHWGDEGQVCIPILYPDEHGFGRPYVIKEAELYRMFYSIRKKNLGYRHGYAESKDGLHWERKDDQIGLDVSDTGWDSQTVCYSAFIRYHHQTYLFYNGNDFGKTGVGFACLEKE